MGAYGKGRPKRFDALSGTGSKPPKAPGEYRIRDIENKTKYVGITNNLDRRINEHKKSGKINNEARIVDWMPAKPGTPYDDIRDHERYKIEKLKPYANKRGGGAGPTPKKMNYYSGSSPDTGNTGRSGGCYIATCVYGSYDCPEVWILRRFRDYKLLSSRFGRIFVKAYYTISPIIVNKFGNNLTFKRIFQGFLNRKIEKLKKLGYQDTPYKDI